ncbi:MAG: hypothetical protein M1438_20320 [Deltaproteobacteria bacterium]|nr:hypothetical protein [Deltaproteobacteria bacterium]
MGRGSLLSATGIQEYSPDGYATGWFFDYTKLPGCPQWGFFSTATNCICNRQDGYLVVGGWQYSFGGKEIHFWKDFETSHPIHLGCIYLPSQKLYNFAWENNKNFWMIWQGGRLAKVNMTNMQIEVYSKIDDPRSDDVAYYVAWDSKRGELAIFRQRQDTATFAANDALEVYRPIPRPMILTKPVPVAPLRVNQQVPFTFHLIGDGGEGVSPYLVNASLAEPATGKLVYRTTQTRDYGWGTFTYQAPELSCAETLQLMTEVTESEG